MAGLASKTLPPKEKADKDQLNRALIRVFEYLDKEGDGLVSVEELVLYFEDASIELGESQVESLMAEADDGRISCIDLQNLAIHPLYSTFKHKAEDLIKEVRKVIKERKVEAVWSAMDKNMDGMVTKGEYGVALNSLNKRQIDFIFARYDQDGDKNLSQEEFTKMMESWKKPKKRKKKRRKE